MWNIREINFRFWSENIEGEKKPGELDVDYRIIWKIIFEYISNKLQRYTVYFIWKLRYMFRAVPPSIIRSANNCIYSI